MLIDLLNQLPPGVALLVRLVAAIVLTGASGLAIALVIVHVGELVAWLRARRGSR